MIESFPVYTDNGTLRNESPRIDIIDDLENRIGLALFCQDKHHFHLLSRIKPGPVDHSHTSVQSINLPTDLLIFTGNNEELDRLARAVNHLVNHIHCDKQRHIPVNNLLQIV